jgi:hypothetical protein
MNKEYNNTAILSKCSTSGIEIIHFYESLGFKNSRNLRGINDIYYGVENNKIDSWVILPKHFKIITLESKLELDIWI